MFKMNRDCLSQIVLVVILTILWPMNCQTKTHSVDNYKNKDISGSLVNFNANDNEGLKNFMCDIKDDFQKSSSSHADSFRSTTLTPTNSADILTCQSKSKRLESVTIHKQDFKGDHADADLFLLNNNTYKRDDFCISSVLNDHFEFAVCNPIDSNLSPVVLHKCCKSDEKMLINSQETSLELKYSCVKGTDQWESALFKSTMEDFSDHIHVDDSRVAFQYQIGFPNCTDYKELDNNKDIWFKMLRDGSVVIGLKFWFKAVWLPVDGDNQGFCVDELVKSDMTNEQQHNQTDLTTASSIVKDDSNGHYSHHKSQILLYCRIQRFDDYLFHRVLFGSLCILASMIILILLIIYLSIWDKQNLAGWTQFNIFLAVFFVFLMEGSRTLIDANGLYVEATTSCTIIAAIAQYFFFAFNTTWSVMCFDLFWTFWKLEASVKGVKENLTRLMAYLTFSWVLPLVIVCVAFGYSHLSANDAKERLEGVYAFAHRRCSSPIRDLGFKSQAIMFLLNLCFFSCTAFLIWKHRRGMNASRKNSKREKYTWTSVMLFAKLLIVMGVSSCSIPLDYLFGSDDPLSPFAVLLRGVHLIPVLAVLFIFGFNEKNLRLIKQKYPSLGEIMIGCNIKPSTTETNPSRSEAKNSQT